MFTYLLLSTSICSVNTRKSGIETLLVNNGGIKPTSKLTKMSSRDNGQWLITKVYVETLGVKYK